VHFVFRFWAELFDVLRYVREELEAKRTLFVLVLPPSSQGLDEP
jgi:hypothetical protein